MRGVGTARAAISVVNALPLQVGAAVGVEWPVRSTATWWEAPPRARALTVDPPRCATPLVRASVRLAAQRFASAAPGRIALRLRSTIPVARGLKSSSAVSSSVVLATARSAGALPDEQEIARASAEVGRTTGVSATGAFDDALAGLVTGGVVTDNRQDRLLRRFRLDPDLGVALWIPPGSHPRSPSLRRRFQREPALAHRAVDAVLDGAWPEAMEANSTLVEHAMGYRYERLRAAVRDAGAVGAGVSGLGPTFAAVAPRGRLARIVRCYPREGRRRSLRLFLSNPRAREARP